MCINGDTTSSRPHGSSITKVPEAPTSGELLDQGVSDDSSRTVEN
ncbi:UNVERIFIED_ORG: hypothetical protein FNL38_102785 [Nocardia globerula]|uniref:Uncharacterized protein n=1 Tax=Nocardia globerula TaxID=1818 RepID=A0A652YU93_NOCGL|nr:hypothetical protein SZ00_04166 [Rhodococcus sp. AD45]PVX67609.1 hypothetical protein C8E04_4973 [Rhodococcus globerulus]